MARNQPRLGFRLAGTSTMVTARAGPGLPPHAAVCEIRIKPAMTKLDKFLAYSQSHRLAVCMIAALWIGLIAWWDATLPNVTIGFLYLFPILFSAPALN